MHTCPRCRHEFKYPYLLKRHLLRKYKCLPFEPPKPQIKHNNLNSKNMYHNKSKNNTNTTNLPDNANSTKCPYCTKTFSKKYIAKHYREFCPHIPVKIKKVYEYEYKKHKLRKETPSDKSFKNQELNLENETIIKHLKKLKKYEKVNNKKYKKVDNKKDKILDNTIDYNRECDDNDNDDNYMILKPGTKYENNGTINNISGSNNGNINITNNVISINPFGKENINISPEEKERILNAKEAGYHETLKCIFNRAENRNFFASGKKYVCCLDGEGNLGLKDKKDALYTISDTGEKAYSKILTDGTNDISKRQMKVNNIKAEAISNGEYEDEHIKYSELILVEKSIANEKFLKGNFMSIDDKFLAEIGKNYVLKLNN